MAAVRQSVIRPERSRILPPGQRGGSTRAQTAVEAFRLALEHHGADAAIGRLPQGRTLGLVVPCETEPLIMYGSEWQIDSSAFNKWLVTYFREYTPVRVWHWMAGDAEYGAVLRTTQKSIAEGLGMHQQHVGRAINDLASLDLLWMEKRGYYWLNPFVTIKGGGIRQAEALENLNRVGAPAGMLRLPVLPGPGPRESGKRTRKESTV